MTHSYAYALEVLIGAALALVALYWSATGGPARLLSWLKEYYLYLRLWRKLQDFNDIAVAGRQDKEIRQMEPFKAFEAWLQDGWRAHAAGDYGETAEILALARAAFHRLAEEQQVKLLVAAERLRQQEYFLLVADKCQ